MLGAFAIIVKSCQGDDKDDAPKTDPDRERKCKVAFKGCLGSGIPEAKCFEGYNSCIKTSNTFIFPGYGPVK